MLFGVNNDFILTVYNAYNFSRHCVIHHNTFHHNHDENDFALVSTLNISSNIRQLS